MFDRIPRNADVITASAMVVISIGLGVAELMGVLSWLSLREKLLAALLVLLGLLMLAAGRILDRQHRSDATLKEIERKLRKLRIADLPLLGRGLESEFELVAGTVVRERLAEMQAMLETQTLRVEGAGDQFRRFYVDVIDGLGAGTVLLATSFARSDFFWRGSQLDEATAAYIARGGRLQRVFFVAPDQLAERETIDILDRQLRMGVEVFTCDPACVPTGPRLVLYESGQRFGWEVHLDRQHQIGWAQVTARGADVRALRAFYASLDACPSLTAYGDRPRKFHAPSRRD